MAIEKQDTVDPKDDIQPFNAKLKDYTAVIEDWEYHETAKFLHEWVQRFNEEFKLDIDTPAVRIDKDRKTRLGSYRNGRNGHGLRREITLNARHLHVRTAAQTLETLLHELIHQWQELHGKPGKHNYHNREFIEKAADCGLIVDEYGHSAGDTLNPFNDLLNKHSVDTIPLPKVDDLQTTAPAETKMKKWVCECTEPTIIRAAVEVQAQCLRCQKVFRRA